MTGTYEAYTNKQCLLQSSRQVHSRFTTLKWSPKYHDVTLPHGTRHFALRKEFAISTPLKALTLLAAVSGRTPTSCISISPTQRPSSLDQRRSFRSQWSVFWERVFMGTYLLYLVTRRIFLMTPKQPFSVGTILLENFHSAQFRRLYPPVWRITCHRMESIPLL